jgi:hypothetical protein
MERLSLEENDAKPSLDDVFAEMEEMRHLCETSPTPFNQWKLRLLEKKYRELGGTLARSAPTPHISSPTGPVSASAPPQVFPSHSVSISRAGPAVPPRNRPLSLAIDVNTLSSSVPRLATDLSSSITTTEFNLNPMTSTPTLTIPSQDSALKDGYEEESDETSTDASTLMSQTSIKDAPKKSKAKGPSITRLHRRAQRDLKKKKSTIAKVEV